MPLQDARKKDKNMDETGIKTLEWLGSSLRILDQSRLPHEQTFIDTADYRDVVLAIKTMQVRGAPTIGVAAAYGIALGALAIKTDSEEEFRHALTQVMADFAATRPTAVNLFHAIGRMRKAAAESNFSELKERLARKAEEIHRQEIEATRRLSLLGAELIRHGDTVLTYCNAGPLATTGYGTALGIIKAAYDAGKKIAVFSAETRPLLQGARLTTWELKQMGIPVTLITDSMAGYFMNRGKINCAVVGADRIATNGDAANKIGTYTVSVLAHENNIPFYIAAPTSTIDLSLASGAEIPIEERAPEEITHIKGIRIAAEGIAAANPAFDVTPHRYISAIVTEKGVLHEPYAESLKKALA